MQCKRLEEGQLEAVLLPHQKIISETGLPQATQIFLLDLFNHKDHAKQREASRELASKQSLYSQLGAHPQLIPLFLDLIKNPQTQLNVRSNVIVLMRVYPQIPEFQDTVIEISHIKDQIPEFYSNLPALLISSAAQDPVKALVRLRQLEFFVVEKFAGHTHLENIRFNILNSFDDINRKFKINLEELVLSYHQKFDNGLFIESMTERADLYLITESKEVAFEYIISLVGNLCDEDPGLMRPYFEENRNIILHAIKRAKTSGDRIIENQLISLHHDLKGVITNTILENVQKYSTLPYFFELLIALDHKNQIPSDFIIFLTVTWLELMVHKGYYANLPGKIPGSNPSHEDLALIKSSDIAVKEWVLTLLKKAFSTKPRSKETFIQSEAGSLDLIEHIEALEERLDVRPALKLIIDFLKTVI